jgi:hypothetical protein
MVFKSTGTVRFPSHEDILRSKQRGGSLPKRFLKTIQRRKQLRKASTVSTSLPAEEALNIPPHGEKDDVHATLSSREFGGGIKVDIPITRPEAPDFEANDNSQEFISLEESIRKAHLTFDSQTADYPQAGYIGLSFGTSRLVRSVGIDSDDEDIDVPDKGEELIFRYVVH